MNDTLTVTSRPQLSVPSYYQPSGKIGCLGLPLLLLVGIPCILVLGFVYGYAIYYIPFIYFNFFIVLGYGGVTGFVVGKLARLGKVRNGKIIFFSGLLAGLLAEYTGWIAWLTAMAGDLWMLGGFLFPSEVLSLIRVLNQEGAWSILGVTPTGWFLYLIWIVEAIMVIGTAVLLCAGTGLGDPYCEKCKRWVDQEEMITLLEQVADPNMLKAKLEKGDYASILSLKKASGDRFTKIKLRQCTSCQQLNTLSVFDVTSYLNNKGEPRSNEWSLVDQLLISPEAYTAITTAER
jgi:hypothetical protein